MADIAEVRIGNTIDIEWDITDDRDNKVALNKDELTLILETPRKRRIKMNFEVEGSTVLSVYQGRDQRELGAYRLMLYGNYNKDGQWIVDAIGFVMIPMGVGNASKYVRERVKLKSAGVFFGKTALVEQGVPGKNGRDCVDGFSPALRIEEIAGGHRVKIVDIEGEKEMEVMNGYTPQKGVDYFDGEDGYTPQKGTDYWTPEDVADMERAKNNANLATANANNATDRANASATNADEKASLVQDNINLNTQKADNAVHTSTEAKSVADDALFKAQGAVGTANSAVQLAQQAKAIAEGKNNSRVFDNKAALNSWLTVAENKAQLKVGDNFYIIATDSPDYWWDGESLQVLESEHPDLTEYVKNTDIATATNPGVVKVNPSYGLDVTTPSNTLYVTKSSNSEIVAKINGYKPIVPATLDYAVKVGVTTNTIALTPEEQIAAKQWLGIVPISQEDYEALVDKSGINFVIPDDYD